MKKLPFIILGFFVLFSFVSPYLPLKDPEAIDLKRRLESPSFTNIFGTDELGRDLFSRIVNGSRISIKICFISLILAMALGGFLGGMAGFSKGIFDFAFSRFIDLLLSLPGILLSILILAFFKRGETALIFALSITSWIGFAKTSRIISMKMRGENFIEFSIASGAGNFYILKSHIFLNIFPVLATQATALAAGIIMTESALSFLGLGLPPPTPTLGSILSSGCDYLLESPHIVAFSALYLLLFLWSLYRASDVLNENLV